MDERFYVRLEDTVPTSFLLDETNFDSSYFDALPALLDRVIARNNRDLIDPDLRRL